MLKLLLKLAGGLLEAAVLLLICCTPLTAVWLVSSLAAHLGGPRWTCLAAGLALCPVLPLAWEAYSLYQRHKRKAAARTWFVERLSMRIFALSLGFLICLLAAFPRAGFLALSTRGDWMLDTAWVRGRVSEPRRQQARQALLKCADGLEWLYQTVSPNRYKQLVDDRFKAGSPTEDAQPTPQPPPPPQPQPDQHVVTPPPQPDPNAGAKPIPPTPKPVRTPPAARWPAKNGALSPAVESMPPAAEASLDTVAEYLAHEEATPAGRLRLLHDYVADRIAYDVAALLSAQMPDQAAAAVFQRRTAVCAGYSNLTAALGEKMGLKVVVVVGDSRDEAGEISPGGHAWNAAELDGRWYLMDVTWDSGNVNGPIFEKSFGTDYYLAPPKVFLLNHLPEQDAWQLQTTPMSRVEFVRQPMLRPKFYALGLQLVAPTHQQNDGGKQVSVQVSNPGHVKLAAVAKPAGAAVPGQCDRTTTEAAAKLTCALPAPGRYDVILFAFPPEGNTGESVASLQFNRQAE